MLVCFLPPPLGYLAFLLLESRQLASCLLFGLLKCFRELSHGVGCFNRGGFVALLFLYSFLQFFYVELFPRLLKYLFLHLLLI